MATNPQTALQQAHAAAQALHNQLKATNAIGADSATISDAMFCIDTIITALNQEDMASRTGQMQAAGNELTSAVKDLSDLKDQLDDIASRIASLADIGGKVDSLLKTCKQIFAL